MELIQQEHHKNTTWRIDTTSTKTDKSKETTQKRNNKPSSTHSKETRSCKDKSTKINKQHLNRSDNTLADLPWHTRLTVTCTHLHRHRNQHLFQQSSSPCHVLSWEKQTQKSHKVRQSTQHKITTQVSNKHGNTLTYTLLNALSTSAEAL